MDEDPWIRAITTIVQQRAEIITRLRADVVTRDGEIERLKAEVERLKAELASRKPGD